MRLKLYPNEPGWKGTLTSKEAAERKISTRARDINKVLQALQESPEGLTADEIAFKYGEIFNKFRPRCSELKNKNLIEPTGERRKTFTGGNQDVLRLCHD